jgi:hypothetical protein
MQHPSSKKRKKNAASRVKHYDTAAARNIGGARGSTTNALAHLAQSGDVAMKAGRWVV